jgi:RNA polymerase sigma-70 factor, ECF subfamily
VSIGNRGLVARASRGDVDAFSKLVQEHSGLVHRAALRVLGAEDAQDASQEVWCRVWANIKNFRGESAFSTWLYRITMNTCLRALRRKRTQEAWELGQVTAYSPEISGDDDDPEEAALASERRNEILAALHHVRAEHRAALVLRHMEGLSYVEIAEVLGIPDGTAKGWASRGRAAMLVALVKRTTAATERGGGRRQTPVNQEEHREALEKTGACAEGKPAYLSSTGAYSDSQ